VDTTTLTIPLLIALLPEDRRSRTCLRHTFRTHIVENEISGDLAGHADISTTTIYTDVSPERLERAIADASRGRRGARRLTAFLRAAARSSAADLVATAPRATGLTDRCLSSRRPSIPEGRQPPPRRALP
jgi:hypothetical protein